MDSPIIVVELCDVLFVVNYNGYIGTRTEEAIHYARSLGKKVVYMENRTSASGDAGVNTNELTREIARACKLPEWVLRGGM